MVTETTVTISLGLVAITLGTLAAFRGQEVVVPQRQYVSAHFGVSVLVVTLALAYAVWQFRRVVTESLGAADFASLDPNLVLYATTYGGAESGGIGGVLFGIAPLLACLGVLGGTWIHKGFYVLVVLALLATTQSPGRTITITLTTAAISFYFYVRPKNLPTRARAGALGTTIIAILAVLVYFNAVGRELGKTEELSRIVGPTWVPDFLISPLIYLLGGMSALSRAQETGIDPGEFGRSIYVPMEVADAIGLPVHVPEVISRYVDIPFSFNVFTAFGDVWFDFGFIGVFLFYSVLGWFLATAHRFARAGNLEWAWTSSMIIAVLATSAVSIRVFYVDTVMLIAAGWVVFRFVAWRSQAP
jgi:oligosaccharide repeat unit polymerase